MRRDQPKAPELMKGTLPNIDQPRIPHSLGVPSHLASSVGILSPVVVDPGIIISRGVPPTCILHERAYTHPVTRATEVS